MSVRAYARLADVPAATDLAVVATPAAAVPGVLAECAEAGVKGALVLSAGSRDGGPDAAELGRRVAEQLRGRPMRVLGPGSIGFVCSRTGINATVAPAKVRPGAAGFVG